MSKLKAFKPNILERLRAKNRSNNNQAVVIPKDKGLYAGSCNRSVCLKPGAYWYNHSTQKYYCEQCAYELNKINKRDAFHLYGHLLCTIGKYDKSKYEKIHDLHRNAQRSLNN